MAKNLIFGAETEAYQSLPKETQKSLEKIARAARKIEAYLTVTDREVELRYPGQDPGEELEFRQVLKLLNPDDFMNRISNATMSMRIRWMSQYERMYGLANYLGLKIACRSDEVILSGPNSPKGKTYYYLRTGTPEYPGLDRLVTDLATQALLSAQHITVELHMASVIVGE